jgi:hypothetical protein
VHDEDHVRIESEGVEPSIEIARMVDEPVRLIRRAARFPHPDYGHLGHNWLLVSVRQSDTIRMTCSEKTTNAKGELGGWLH